MSRFLDDYRIWFDTLYLNNSEKMFSVADRILNDAEAAKDIVHATFTTLLSKGKDMMDHPNPVGWLYTAMRYHMGNELQKRVRSMEELYDPQETDFGQSDTYEIFEELFPVGLTDDEKIILRLYFVEGRSYGEIGEYLGKTESACRTRLCRARANFKKFWELEKKSKNTCNKTQGSTNIRDRRNQDARHS